MCDTWQAMCVTHGMPCVNMHGSFKAYIRGCSWLIRTSKGAAARRRRRKGKEEGRKGEEKGRIGNEKGRKRKEKERRKEKKKGEEERKNKKEKEGVLRSEHTQTAKNSELPCNGLKVLSGFSG